MFLEYMIYLIVILILIFFIIRYDINSIKEGRDSCYYFVLVILILIAGLRWRLGSDTPNYMYLYYHETPVLGNYLKDGISIKYPLWILLNSVVLSLGGKFFLVQIIHAIFVNTLYFKYIKKHSPYIFTCAMFYFVWMFTNQNMETMKASMAIVVCLYGNDYMVNKKWLKGFLLYFVGCLFHISAALLLITPFVLFLKFNIVGVISFVLAYIIGGVIQEKLSDYLMLIELSEDLEKSASVYSNSDIYSKGRNLNFFIVNVLSFIIYSFFIVFYFKKKNIYSELIKYEPYLIIGLLFLILKSRLFIFYRYVHFYNIYIVLFVANAFISCIVDQKQLDKALASARSVILFSPLFILLLMYNIRRFPMYYPYSSVIEKKIDKNRESEYSKTGHFIPHPNKNIY